MKHLKTYQMAMGFIVIFSFSMLGSLTLLGSPVPTTLNDFFLPGSQPNESGSIERINRCGNCHSGYNEPAVEPFINWEGCMMSQAARDPFFYACMTIGNQDAPQSGDLCIRCHAPAGWLEGRSTPADGSALTADDRQSVQCDFCHRMLRPSPVGVNPYPSDAYYTANTYPRDQTYLGTISPIPPTSGDGMYVVDSDNSKRGPFSDPVARHTWYYSPFHSDARHCGTCHDVSNPAFTREPNGSYVPNAFDTPAPDFDPYTMFPIERTYSEWRMSDYNTSQGVYAPQFGGNLDTVRTCQDCHLRDVTGHGCDKPDAPLRSNLPLHDMTGGNTVVPTWIMQEYPSEVNPTALDSGMARARRMLGLAATLDLTVTNQEGFVEARVQVTNETGHKLPSGYPEGRRIWIHVEAFNQDSVQVYESGSYDTVNADLIHDPDLKVYEIKPGISTWLSPIVNLPAGPSFHFVINDSIYKDNRIPPRGFTNANFTAIQSPPVAYAYDDGQYWDETVYELPADAARVDVTLFYQTTSREYVEFLRDSNATNDSGQILYDLWAANGKSRPVAMATASALVPVTPPVPVSDLTIIFLATTNDTLELGLNWSAVPNAVSYHVYETLTLDTPGTEIGTTSVPTFTVHVPSAVTEVPRFYYVTASN
jgi:hypothetical protein